MTDDEAKQAGSADRNNGSGDLSKTAAPMTNEERNAYQSGYGANTEPAYAPVIFLPAPESSPPADTTSTSW